MKMKVCPHCNSLTYDEIETLLELAIHQKFDEFSWDFYVIKHNTDTGYDLKALKAKGYIKVGRKPHYKITVTKTGKSLALEIHRNPQIKIP